MYSTFKHTIEKGYDFAWPLQCREVFVQYWNMQYSTVHSTAKIKKVCEVSISWKRLPSVHSEKAQRIYVNKNRRTKISCIQQAHTTQEVMFRWKKHHKGLWFNCTAHCTIKKHWSQNDSSHTSSSPDPIPQSICQFTGCLKSIPRAVYITATCASPLACFALLYTALEWTLADLWMANCRPLNQLTFSQVLESPFQSSVKYAKCVSDTSHSAVWTLRLEWTFEDLWKC